MRSLQNIFLSVLVLVSIASLAQRVPAADFYSDKSIAIMCAPGDKFSEQVCDAYIKGVVEAFYLISDRSRLKQDGGPQYLCERVGKEDWSVLTQTVRANLVQMDKGFAAFEIARVLNKNFCGWAEH